MISRNAQLFLLGTFFLGIGQSAFFSMRNLYWEEMGFSRSEIGYFNSFQLLGTVLLAIPTAIFITRLSSRIVLVFSTLLTFAGYMGQAFCQDFSQILIFCGLLGSASGIIRLSMAPLFMRSSTPKERVYLFNVHRAVRISISVGAMLLAGQLVAYLGVSLGAPVLGYRWVLATGGTASLFAMIPFFLVRTDELKNTDETRKFRLFKVKNKVTILKVCTPEFFIGAGSGLFIPFINLYFKSRLGAGPGEVASYMSMARFALVVGFIFSPVLARRLGMLRSVVATELLSLPFFLMLAFFANPFIVVSAYIARQSLMNMTQPTASNFAMEAVPPREQAITNSMKLLVWNAGRALFAMVGGIVIENYGFTPAILGTALLYLCAALSYILLFRKHPLYRLKEVVEESNMAQPLSCVTCEDKCISGDE